MNKRQKLREKEVLSTDEAAVLVGVCTKTLRKYCRSGEVPHKRLAGKLIFVADELERWKRNKQ